MAITTEKDDGPSSEALSLSASLFTSQISSWIPANFGQSSKSVPGSSTVSSLDTVLLTENDRGERLGLGHPLLEIPKHQRKVDTSSSLSSLSRKLGGDGKGKGKGKQGEEEESGLAGHGTPSAGPAEEEEEESRASIGKKRKVDKVDLWAGKKKPKTKTPPTNSPVLSRQPSTPALSREVADITVGKEEHDNLSPASPISDPPPATVSVAVASSGLNKNQRKKLRKKQKKLKEAHT